MAETNKTEPCTVKKRREAREKGEVARSQELNAAINMTAGLSAAFIMGGYLFRQTHRLLDESLRLLERAPLLDASLLETLRNATFMGLAIVGPLLLVIWVATSLVNYLQIGFQITPKAMQPKFNKLNPINGFKRIFGTRGWAELVKSALKITVVGLIVWVTVRQQLPMLLEHVGAPLKSSVAAAGQVLWAVIWRLIMFFLGVGLFDLIWQRYDFDRKMRMTKQEVKDEYRQAEGDAQIKSARRSKHRRLAQSRLAVEVAKADVVTTNPTHYAVALRYDQQRMRAPRVVAKGERLWAKLIVKIARKNFVPVMENKPLTRALYHQVETGQEVPPKLYRAVAEVLGALYKLRARRGERS